LPFPAKRSGKDIVLSSHKEEALVMHFHSLTLNGNRITIREALSKSKKGDKVSCRIRSPRLIGVFYEIESRGIDIFPPLLSQTLSMSKVHQALHYADFMVPNTQVLFRRFYVQNVLKRCAEKDILKVVIKQDRASMGMGIHPCWSLNELALAVIHVVKPPLVVQPMLENFREFRLLIFGDTIVAKEKINSDKVFWNNRFFGGVTKFITPSKQIVAFAKEIMRIGEFPWAYIDLFVTEDDIFLSELNLSGSNAGLKEYNLNNLKRKMLEKWLATK
jgi:ribosomal protein S6--L-glutamate ligase